MWDELSKILQNNPEMHDAAGRQRKIIIFSEHHDTLNYLHGKIATRMLFPNRQHNYLPRPATCIEPISKLRAGVDPL